MSQDTLREWFAIRTKPQEEQVAKLHYQRQEYEVVLLGLLNQQGK